MDVKYVSSSLLVESSGDSDGDLGLSLCNEVDLDEDDAESCCCDSFDASSIEETIDMDDDDEDDDDDDEDCCEEDDEEYNSYGSRNYVGDGKWKGALVHACEAMQEKQREVEEEEDGSDGIVTEDEKNRLFWDNCLAQGY